MPATAPENPPLPPAQAEILAELQKAKNAEERVRTFARLMDTYGLDAIAGLIPGLGDLNTSVLSGLYLLAEARAAGLGESAYLKIAALETADFFIGAVPVAGDIADYFFQANQRAVPLFEQRTERLVVDARAAGVPESEIAKITEAAQKLPQLAEKAIHLHARLGLADLKGDVKRA